MESNLNTYGYGGANPESYPESQEWEFTLSSSLPEMDNVTPGQFQHALGLGSGQGMQQRPMPFQPPRQQHGIGTGQGLQQQTVEIDQSPPIEPAGQPKKGGKGKTTGSRKRVSQRGKSFNKEEDRVICSAFLNVRKDPIIANNQPSGGYYQRLHEYFVDNIHIPTNRSQVAISNRWLTIQRAVNKFCAFYSIVERTNASGKTEKDRVDDAVKMFEEKEPWLFMHCWEILRHEPKWNDKLLEINSASSSTRVNQELTSNTAGEQDNSEHADNDPLARPEGRDGAKKHRNRGAGDNSASSTAIEVLQSMNERSQMKDDKEDSQMAQILQRKDAKIELQQSLIALQREEMEKRMEIEREKLLLTREEVEMRKEQTKVEMLKAEAHFMGQDLQKLAPHMREYYLSIQREIMERHGIRAPPNNS